MELWGLIFKKLNTELSYLPQSPFWAYMQKNESRTPTQTCTPIMLREVRQWQRTFYDSIYMKCSEYPNLSVQRQRGEWLPGAEGRERNAESVFNRYQVLDWDHETGSRNRWLVVAGNNVSVPETRWLSESCARRNGRFYDVRMFTGHPWWLSW